MKSVLISGLKMDIYAPNTKKCYQKYSFETHHNIPKAMIYFDTTKYCVHEVFSGSGFSGSYRDLCKQTIKNNFYLVKNGKVMRNGKKCQFSVCNHCFTYRSSGEIKDKIYVRLKTFHNKRKNNRGKDGKKLCR